MHVRFKFILVLALVIGSFGSGRASAGEPTEAIRGAVDRAVDVLKSANARDRKERPQVIDRLRGIVYPIFDFREMAMRALASHWRALDADQQKEFTTVFTKLLEKTYAESIDLYNGQQVIYQGETTDGDYAGVDTLLVGKDKQKYSVIYKMHKVDGRWRIYDVVVEGISVVNNYREQFNRTILKTSVRDLLNTMKEKVAA